MIRAKKKQNKLILEIDGGDLDKLNEAKEKYGFIDYQNVIRFFVSVILVNEVLAIGIIKDGVQTEVEPIKSILNVQK